MKNALFTCLLFLAFFTSNAQLEQYTNIPGPSVDSLYSEHVGQNYFLHVTLPLGHSTDGDKKYRVCYYLDSWGLSGMVNDVMKTMMFMREVEPMIMVGISYKTDPFTLGSLRKRDFAPPLQGQSAESGGDKFLNFLKQELLPFIEEKYAGDPSDRGLMGASYAGLFCTYTIKKEPELFHKFLIVSPSLWFGDGYLLKDQELLDNIQNKEKLKVFTACGSLEGKMMTSNTSKLAEILNENENVLATHVLYDEEDHGSVVYPAIIRGMRFLYKDDYSTMISMGDVYYRKMAYDKALKQYERAIHMFPEKLTLGERYNKACLHALLGEKDAAFALLETIAEDGYDNHDWLTKDSDFENLHKDERWIAVAEKVKNNGKKEVK